MAAPEIIDLSSPTLPTRHALPPSKAAITTAFDDDVVIDLSQSPEVSHKSAVRSDSKLDLTPTEAFDLEFSSFADVDELPAEPFHPATIENTATNPNKVDAAVPIVFSSSQPLPTTTRFGDDDEIPEELFGSFDDSWLVEKPAKRRRLSPQPIAPGGGRKSDAYKSTRKVDVEADPIVFTSSPKAGTGTGATRITSMQGITRTETLVLDDEDSDELPDLSALAAPRLRTHLSERTAGLLASLTTNTSGHGKNNQGCARTNSMPIGSPKRRSKLGRTQSDRPQGCAADIQEDSDEAVQATGKVLKKGKLSEAEKLALKEQKDKAKEEEKERKRIAKEEKAREKRREAEIAEVNKAKTDRKITTPEMIVDVSSDLEDSSLGTQIQAFMKNLGVQISFSRSAAVPSVVRWRRKVTAIFNEEAGHWEPSPLRIQREMYVLRYITAKEFVDLATTESPSEDLDSSIRELRDRFQDCKILVLLEGLDSWMRKNKNTKNRAYQNAVRSQDANSGQPNQQRSKKQQAQSGTVVDEDLVEDAVLRLQVVHGCLVHQTEATVDSAQWVAHFTQHISTVPYR